MKVGCRGNFILKRADGRVEAYTGNLDSVDETHLHVKLLNGREVDLLRVDIQKVEWLG